MHLTWSCIGSFSLDFFGFVASGEPSNFLTTLTLFSLNRFLRILRNRFCRAVIMCLKRHIALLMWLQLGYIQSLTYMTTNWTPYERVLAHNLPCHSIIIFPFGVALVYCHNTSNPCIKLSCSDWVHLPYRCFMFVEMNVQCTTMSNRCRIDNGTTFLPTCTQGNISGGVVRLGKREWVWNFIVLIVRQDNHCGQCCLFFTFGFWHIHWRTCSHSNLSSSVQPLPWKKT